MAEKLSDQAQGKELEQKLLGLVAALDETGMEVSMVQMEDGNGGFVLKTTSCPYFEVAQNHREICEMEQDMLADLLGPGVDVKLKGRIIDGQCACEFHVSHISLGMGQEKSKVTSAGVPE
jgi:predicted ArsR family transcriptional regulator